jgi:DNA-binding beta-propeller fold protein YncE
MEHECFGLAHKDGRLFISDFDQTVYIYDKNGKALNRITQDASGRDIFKYNRHIAISASGDRVFVADYFKGVVVFDCQGKYLSTLNDSSVSGCYGVCTDDRNVFVAGNSSHNIVQFGQNFRMLGEIGKNKSSSSLCFDHQQKRLIVTCPMNDKITVIELE